MQQFLAFILDESNRSEPPTRVVCGNDYEEADSLYREWLRSQGENPKVDIAYLHLQRRYGVLSLEKCSSILSSFDPQGNIKYQWRDESEQELAAQDSPCMRLWEHCKAFIAREQLTPKDTAGETRRAMSFHHTFFRGICDIVGYSQAAEEEARLEASEKQHTLHDAIIQVGDIDAAETALSSALKDLKK